VPFDHGFQTHFERRLRGQLQHEVLQATAQVIVAVLVYHPLANVPSEQLQRLYCGLRFSGLPIASRKNKPYRVKPLVKTFSPSSGPLGTSVTITGTGLINTTRVTFGGVLATTFTANSDTQVTAAVPTGAKTGRIAITTPGGIATSATSFTVTP
jgi:hypothetical protein